MRQHGFRTLFFSRLALKILIILSLCGVLPMLVVLPYERKPAGEEPRDVLDTQLAKRKAEAAAWLGERLGEQARWASAYRLFDAVETLLAPAGDKVLALHALTNDLESRQQRTR